MNALILLADGFETTEALTTYDVLLRSHQVEPELCSISSSFEVTSSHGVKVVTSKKLGDIHPEDYGFLILPGGKKGVENLKASKEVRNCIEAFIALGKPVHAICAAPSILEGMGYLDGLPFVCFPGFECGRGLYQENEGVVNNGKNVTARSMGYSVAFAKAIVDFHFGEGVSASVDAGVYGLR